LCPEAQYRIENGTIFTSDEKVVEAAKYIFQFQPGLLVIEHSLTKKDNTTDTAKPASFRKLEFV
jgi:hypothetical protein